MKAACHGGHCVEDLLHESLQKEVPLNSLAGSFLVSSLIPGNMLNTRECAACRGGKKLKDRGETKEP